MTCTWSVVNCKMCVLGSIVEIEPRSFFSAAVEFGTTKTRTKAFGASTSGGRACNIQYPLSALLLLLLDKPKHSPNSEALALSLLLSSVSINMNCQKGRVYLAS